MPTETQVRPPADYHPGGRAEWVTDEADVFYAPAEERQWIADPKAPPSPVDMRKLWEGRVTVNRVILEGKRYVWALPIVNSGPLAQLRPTSPDVITVRPEDALHVAVWRHLERRRWAQNQIHVEADRRAREAAQSRCQICSTVLFGNVSTLGPWTKGRGLLCPACADTINLAGAMRHLETHRAAIDAWLE